MKEFGKHGILGHLNYDQRYELFDQLEKVINYYKIFSVAFILDQKNFEEIIGNKIRKQIGVYGTCFMGCAHLIFGILHHSNYYKNIAFILEDGNEHTRHIRRAHRNMLELQDQKIIKSNVGTLSFGSKTLPALQAADIIAWGERRRVSGNLIGNGFQPIKAILDNEKHVRKECEKSWLYKYNDSVHNNPKIFGFPITPFSSFLLG